MQILENYRMGTGLADIRNTTSCKHEIVYGTIDSIYHL